MKIILDLITFFFSVILLLSIILFIWDKFFKTDENTTEVEKFMTESEERMKISYVEEDEAMSSK